MTWHQIPFVRLLFPFLAGIFLYHTIGAVFSWTSHLGILGIFLVALSVLTTKKEASIFAVRAWGLSLFLCLIQLGYFLGYHHDQQNNSNHLSNQKTLNQTFLATVITPPQLSSKSIRTTLALQQKNDSSSSDIHGKIVAYFQLDSSSATLQYGDQILFQSNIESLPPPQNPKGFDSRNYYYPKGIYHQSYIPADHWKKVAHNQGSQLQQLLYDCQFYLLEIIKKNIPSPNEQAVASALILGSKDQLSKEIKNAYSDTGAMHVLAVSGLHVGILIALLNFLLGFYRKPSKGWKTSKVLLLLFVLWGFALLTGASASVMRAATMFSFVLVGQLFHQKINIYNSLAASAFVLLCFNPFLLYDIGFQLSYLALIGIVYLHPKIYRRWYIENKLGDWIWNGVAMSIAAQLFTLPIGLYYFNQFPVYFWLSGIVVAAAAGVILGLGICLLVLSWVPVLNVILGFLLYYSIWMMNSLIFVIHQLPYAVWDGFWLEFWQVLCWYFILGTSIILLFKKQLKWALLPLTTCLLLVGHRAYAQYQQEQQNLLCIYHQRNASMFSYISGKNSLTMIDSTLAGSPQLAFAQEKHLWSLGITNQKIIYLEDSIQNQVCSYNNKKGQLGTEKIFLFGNAETTLDSHTPLDVEIVLVYGNPKIKSIQEINSLCFFKKIVFDASNSRWKIDKWVEECQELGIEYVDVSKDGAWVLEL